MPSSLTHYVFNKELYDNNIRYLKGNEDIYLLGAQGPDPFFFRGIIPSFNNKNAKEIRGYGTRLHKIEPSKVFYNFFKYSNENENKDVLYAYILGAGLHYILDRKVHPYVFYKTGFSDNKKLKKKYFASHTLFETHMDVLLLNGKYSSYKVKPSECIKCKEDKVEEVSKMYEYIARNIVKEEFIDDDAFEDSYKDMVKIENLLYSKRGIKKWFASVLFKNTPLNTMMHPISVKDDEKKDYLNIKMSEWKNPASEVSYNKSIYDLFEEAKEESNQWIKLVNNAYDGNFNENELREFTKTFIYDGYKEGEKMKVFEGK